MKLTDGERLIVVMLAEVMEALKLDGEIDPALVKRLAINNDDWAIRDTYHGIFHGESPNDAEVSETYDILSMWSFIEYSISELEGDEATEAANFHYTRFTGFDGNHDPHYHIAHTLINDLGKFEQFADHPLNSHSQATLPRYRQIKQKYDAAMHGTMGEPLSFDVLKDMLN
jgi:uncharacterized protein